MDAQRALLDELMGTARNLTEEERRGHKEITWDDKEVCGFYMVRFCPHDLFVNTRSDLGPCPRIHDQKLKESFEQSPRHDAYVPKFEAELAQFCEKLVMDLDRRVRRGRERLAQEVEPTPSSPLTAEKSEQLAVVEEKIKNLLEQVESLGEAGKVDEAEALMRKVEALNIEKAVLTQQPQNNKVLMLAQEKKMALCEICGSFLVANDAAERTQSHVTGKQHVGYGMVRDFVSEYKAAKEKAKEEERLVQEKEAEERRKLREKDYERKQQSDSSDRVRHRDKDGERDRDRYRERDRDHERSRERDGRGNRDGGRGLDSRYRNGRDGGRDRYRDRSRSRSPVRHSHRRREGWRHKNTCLIVIAAERDGFLLLRHQFRRYRMLFDLKLQEPGKYSKLRCRIKHQTCCSLGAWREINLVHAAFCWMEQCKRKTKLVRDKGPLEDIRPGELNQPIEVPRFGVRKCNERGQDLPEIYVPPADEPWTTGIFGCAEDRESCKLMLGSVWSLEISPKELTMYPMLCSLLLSLVCLVPRAQRDEETAL
ncbi:hypothetical protein L6164_017623 [Bauhinia variegata]|uniref:Uncharacterized protein n=1 Tax=Bauhinia variegata TaxID=167791 RepID=A0ACB9N8I4_BAUVA|nr:hypothetical protein L6164_017623 [Bauhinia variegata]